MQENVNHDKWRRVFDQRASILYPPSNENNSVRSSNTILVNGTPQKIYIYTFRGGTRDYLDFIIDHIGDYDDLVRLGSQCKDIERYTAGKLLTAMKKSSYYVTFATKPNYQIVGIAVHMIRKNSIFIDVLCASSSSKFKGVGTALLKHVEREAKRHQKSHLELTSVLANNTLEFYKKRGFTRGPRPGSRASTQPLSIDSLRNQVRLHGGVPKNVFRHTLLAKTGTMTEAWRDKKQLMRESLNSTFHPGFEGVLYVTNKDEIGPGLPKLHKSVPIATYIGHANARHLASTIVQSNTKAPLWIKILDALGNGDAPKLQSLLSRLKGFNHMKKFLRVYDEYASPELKHILGPFKGKGITLIRTRQLFSPKVIDSLTEVVVIYGLQSGMSPYAVNFTMNDHVPNAYQKSLMNATLRR